MAVSSEYVLCAKINPYAVARDLCTDDDIDSCACTCVDRIPPDDWQGEDLCEP